MHVAVRSYLTAGVVTVGAAAIVLSPIAPTMPDVHLPSVRDAQVQLSAAVGPIETWLAVIDQTFTNVGAIGNQVLADPAPILSQIFDNQLANASTLGDATQKSVTALISALQGVPATIQTALALLANGDIVGAANALLSPVLPDLTGIVLDPFFEAFKVVTNTAQNFTNALEQIPLMVGSLGLPLLGPVYSAVNALAATAQTVLDEAGTGDPAGIVNALVNAPAALTGAVLNGYGVIPGLGLPAAGILSPLDPIFGSLTAGPIAALLSIRDNFAAAIKPATVTQDAATKSLATSAVAALPAGGTTVTLATGSTTTTKAAPGLRSAAAPAAADLSPADATGATDTDSASTTPVKAKHRASVDNPVSSAIKKAVGAAGADKTHKSTHAKSTSQ